MKKLYRIKNRNFFDKYIKISTIDLSLGGVFIGLSVFSSQFLQISFGHNFKAGITYVFMILFGFIFGPLKGGLFSLIAKYIEWISKGYFINFHRATLIPVMIPIMSYIFKILVIDSSKKNNKKWWISIIFINIIIYTIMIIMIIMQKKIQQIIEQKITYTLFYYIYICMYVIMFFLIILFLTLLIFYKIKKIDILKQIISFGSLVILIILIWIIIWGPICVVINYWFLSDKTITTKEIWAVYKLNLFLRLLKTPFIIPIYTFILIPLYKATDIFLKSFNKPTY